MFSSVTKLFCCQPNETNEDRMNRITSATLNSNFTPMSTITSASQKFLSLIQPNEGDIATIGLKTLDKLGKYSITKIVFVNTHCLMLVDNDYDRVFMGFGSNVMGQLGLNIIPHDTSRNYYDNVMLIQPEVIKNRRIIDFATCEKYSIVLIESKEDSKRKLISFGTNPWEKTTKDSGNKEKVNELKIEIDLFSIDKIYMTHDGLMLIFQSTTNGLYIKETDSHNNTFRLLHQFNHKIISVVLMHQSIVVALNNNTIVTFGANSYINSTKKENSNNLNSNSNIFSNHLIKKVVCGLNHGLILCQDGAVFSFGENKYNQCTTGNEEYIKDPHPVIFSQVLNEENTEGNISNDKPFITDIACGDTFSLAINSCGNVFIWGTSDFFFAQDDQSVTSPKKIDKLYLDNIKAIWAFGNSVLCFGETN